MQIRCRTLFDITPTGITGHFRPERLPFRDDADQLIDSQKAWNRARNQQRNWETLTQLISLRTQVSILESPLRYKDCWQFAFEFDQDVFGSDLSVLISDCDGIPMLLNLGEKSDVAGSLQVDQNIWFESVSVNN